MKKIVTNKASSLEFEKSLFSSAYFQLQTLTRKLKESEEKYSRVFDLSPVPLALNDGNNVLLINPVFTKTFGYTIDDISPLTLWWRKAYPDTAYRKYVIGEWQSRLRKMELHGTKFREMEVEVCTKNGETKTILASASYIDANSKTTLVSLFDITERKTFEQRALSIGKRDEAILGSIGDGVFACDKNGIIMLFNFVAETLTGIKASNAIGKHYSEIISITLEENPKLKVDCIADVKAMEKSLAITNHTMLIRKDRSRIPISSSASPVRSDDGKVIGFVVILRDVAEERRVDKAKTEFVSLASHQLRTPLTSINWYSEMLLSEDLGKLTTSQRQYAQEIYSSSTRMVKLVNALLNVARLEMGVVEINPEKVKLCEVVESCIKDLDNDIFLKKLTVTHHCDSDVTDLSVDVKILTIILQNFISNSVKYCKVGGKIHVSIRKDKSLVIISVADNGIGIPKQQQRFIFTKLFRADNARLVDSEGSGLGLFIISEIMRQIDGRVWFESSLRKGTTFFASLPIVGRYRAGNKGLI